MKLERALQSTNEELASTLDQFAGSIEGEVQDDLLHRLLYAQDASVYAKVPDAVVFPKSTKDVKETVKFADTMKIPVVTRAAGTSLAGQTIGNGIVIDIGRHMNRILSLDVEKRTVRVQPGVVLEELNRYLEPHGLWFGPDTSTANRCMIGGMIGNNSCGTHSILYGNTMQHVVSMEVVLTDGTVAEVGDWDADQISAASHRDDRLGDVTKTILSEVESHHATILENFPDKSVVRRNTGYAIDDIAFRAPFGEDGAFSLARFLCGSEGTLAITTEVTLNLVPRPKEKFVVCAHFHDLMDALKATVIAVEHDPSAVELIDKRILDQTKNNLEQSRNRFFIEGDPEAILVVEFYRDSTEELRDSAKRLIAAFRDAEMGYAFPIIEAPDDAKVWSLRKAGLGILMGIPGDKKAVSVVEDTAVPVKVLPEYVADVMEIMHRENVQTVYHAHASVGELHIRPELNLKDPVDVEKFVRIGEDVADLVRKYGGSLSGEHGDGRVRSPLIERFLGEDVVQIFSRIKQSFDPNGILNPHNIVDPNSMTDDFRFDPGTQTPDVPSVFDWSGDQGFFRAVEKCNGAGVCRKKAEAGGTMCPSYMATLDEKDTTRGRANVLRELMLASPTAAMQSDLAYDALDLCLSCKGCKSECPANVDMARIKAEFLQQYYDANGVPMSANLIGHFSKYAKYGSIFGALGNGLAKLAPSKFFLKMFGSVSPKRHLPKLHKHFSKSFREIPEGPTGETVYLYVDPFIGFTEPHIAKAVCDVLKFFGFGVKLLPVDDDGRTLLSKGFLREAKGLAEDNVRKIDSLTALPIVGIEPSSLLTFRDEVPDLVDGPLQETATRIAERCFLFDEFLVDAFERGVIAYNNPGVNKSVSLHGHCHQKALVGNDATIKLLQAFGADVETIPSGCCGMAGSFGYEDRHYDVSMAVGELILFPAVRETDFDVIAPGTSCRHQIEDGTGKRSTHPATWIVENVLGQIEK